jgi:hypothetical protein
MRMNLLLRAFGAAAVVLASVPFLLFGIVSMQRASHVRELDPYEREVVVLGERYVGDHLRATGTYPTAQAFKAWAQDAGFVISLSATSRLPPQWTVLDYDPPAAGRSEYRFRIWDGDCNSWWYAEPQGNTRLTVDPACYYAFGSRSADLIASFGASALLLVGAYRIARPRRATRVR